MAAPQPVDDLPPEARFALRAVAAGSSIDDAGALMRLDGPTVRKHLRTAARGLGLHTPPPSEGDAALVAALQPALAAAAVAPSRASSTKCPGPDVMDALAASALDGPLLLAEIDHAADCPSCLARLLSSRRTGVLPRTDERPARRSPWPVVIGAAIGIGLAAWYLLS